MQQELFKSQFGKSEGHASVNREPYLNPQPHVLLREKGVKQSLCHLRGALNPCGYQVVEGLHLPPIELVIFFFLSENVDFEDFEDVGSVRVRSK